MHIIARVNVGGTARWLETLTSQQVKNGQEVLIVTGEVQGDEVEDPVAASLPLKRVRYLGRNMNPYHDARAFVGIRDLLGDFAPDVVNTHTAKAGALGRLAAHTLTRRRPAIVHTVHGHLMHGYFDPLVAHGVRVTERVLAMQSDLVLAVGEAVRDDLVRAGVVAPERVVAVRPGVSDVRRAPRGVARELLGITQVQASPVAGWLGRLARVKRPDRLLGAAAATPDVSYLVGGDGSLGPGLTQRASANVHSLGWVDPTLFWSACDLAVLTSDNEGMPTSLIESALAGIPAVTTHAGGSSEIVVDGVTGLVVGRSAHAVAEGVKYLVDDSSALQAMGAAARQWALAEFSPESMLTQHNRAYALALAHRP